MRPLFLLLFALCATAASAAEDDRILDRIDHMVFAVTDLDDGIEQLESATGVRAEFGGSHPGQGTHNALLSLGPRVYLEILAPDPKQSDPRSMQSLGLSEQRSSRLITWAVRAPNMDKLVQQAAERGTKLQIPSSGTRKRSDDQLLSWRSTELADDRRGDGLAPFFIDWGTTEHPAATSPKGVRLVALRIQHPSPESVQSLFDSLDVPLIIQRGPDVALIAVLDSPRGRVELR